MDFNQRGRQRDIRKLRAVIERRILQELHAVFHDHGGQIPAALKCAAANGLNIAGNSDLRQTAVSKGVPLQLCDRAGQRHFGQRKHIGECILADPLHAGDGHRPDLRHIVEREAADLLDTTLDLDAGDPVPVLIPGPGLSIVVIRHDAGAGDMQNAVGAAESPAHTLDHKATQFRHLVAVAAAAVIETMAQSRAGHGLGLAAAIAAAVHAVAVLYTGNRLGIQQHREVMIPHGIVLCVAVAAATANKYCVTRLSAGRGHALGDLIGMLRRLDHIEGNAAVTGKAQDTILSAGLFPDPLGVIV